MGELEKVAQQCDRSADELEQWTLWQGPEVGCYQTLDKKKELLTTLCSVVACENPVPHAKVKQLITGQLAGIGGKAGLLALS